MENKTKEYAIKALFNECPKKTMTRLSILLSDEDMDLLSCGVPVDVDKINIEALQKYVFLEKITQANVTNIADNRIITIAYKYETTDDATDDGWFEISVNEARQLGICKFKYV